MKKLLLFVAAALMAMTASSQLYFRGDVNNWGNDGLTADWQFDANGVLNKSFELSGSFKIADNSWGEEYGSSESAKIGTINVVYKGGNIACAGKKFNVTKMTIDIMAETLTIEGSEVSNPFDVTKDYSILFRQYTTDTPTNDPMTFKGNGTYEATVVLQQQEFGCKFADASYNPINYGTGEGFITVGVPYNPVNGAANNMWFDDNNTPEWGASYKITLVITSNWVATATFEKATAAEEAVADASSSVFKVIENGQVFIIKGGVKYNLLGAPVK